VRTRKEGADLSIPSVVGAPCFSRGSWTSVQRKNRFIAKDWALALDLSRPALKRMITVEHSPAALKRCFLLLKQRAPTKLGVWICGFFSGSHADSKVRTYPTASFSAAC
jgi:hypothetical protein